MATKSIRYTRMYRTCRWRWIRYVHYESTINQTRVLRVISVNDWSARVASRTSRRFVSHARFSQRDSYKTIHLSIVSSIYFLARGNIDIKMFARLLSSRLFSIWRSFARVEIKNPSTFFFWIIFALNLLSSSHIHLQLEISQMYDLISTINHESTSYTHRRRWNWRTCTTSISLPIIAFHVERKRERQTGRKRERERKRERNNWKPIEKHSTIRAT